MAKLLKVPDQDRAFMVEILREVLAAAESGEVGAVGIVTMGAGGVVRGAWGGQLTFQEKVGLLEQLKFQMFASCKPAEEGT